MQFQSEKRKTWSVLCSTASANRAAVTVLSAALLLAQQGSSNYASTQTVSGTLYAENFTYYKLNGEGWLRLELHSLGGDVDLYVSGVTQHPTFQDYELKSESCGVDVVDIHSDMKRPVGIGLYAHPFYLQSSYRLDIKVVKEVEVDEYERLFQTYHFYSYDGEQDLNEAGNKLKGDKKSRITDESDEDDGEPLWWTIFVTLVKFLFEVVM